MKRGTRTSAFTPTPAYTDEMGAAHGNFTLTRDEIRGVLEDSIDTQFLVLE